MKKGRILKSTLMTFMAIVLASVAFLGLNTTSAAAFDGGSGGGGSGSGGGNSLPSTWRWVYSNSLDGLRNAPGIGAHGGAQQYVTDSSGGAALWNNYCLSPNLVRVYWIQNSQYVVSMTSSGLAQPWNNPAGGDTIDQYASTLNYRGTYIICVVNPIESRTHTETENQNRDDGAGRTFTADYSWTTAVTPELNDASDVDPIGVDNLNSQPASTVNSDFSAVYDSIVGGGGNYDAKAAQIQNAITKDASKAHATVNLNDDNKAGLAEGGVLSVAEQTRRATITLTQNWTESRSRQVTCDYRPRESTPIAGSCRYGGWTAWSENNGSRNHNVNKNLGTQVNSGFFQLLSVHCNPNEFNTLASRLTALGGAGAYELISQTTGVDGQTTSVIRTQHFSSRTDALNARRLLGVSSASQSAEVNRTSQLGFYDKECNVQCVSNPAAASGASSANGAVSNVSITSNNQANPGTYGGANLVKNGSTNSNYFEIFRDNDTNRITVNTAYPRNNDPQLKYGGTFRNAANTANVTIPASAPVSTTVTRWAEGTPGTNKDDEGGVFQMTAVNGSTSRPLFQSQTGNVGVQRNFGVNPYSSPNSEVLNGFFRTFDVQSTWASEKDKPQVINIKWEYRPTVYTRFPTNVGFTANSNSAQFVANTEAVVDQPVDVKCYAQYGSYDRNLDLSNRVQSSTGTGSTNALDSAPLEAPSGDNSWVTQSNLVIKFVRGVAE